MINGALIWFQYRNLEIILKQSSCYLLIAISIFQMKMFMSKFWYPPTRLGPSSEREARLLLRYRRIPAQRWKCQRPTIFILVSLSLSLHHLNLNYVFWNKRCIQYKLCIRRLVTLSKFWFEISFLWKNPIFHFKIPCVNLR